ncbi:NAD(P)/FAD-dependent oxidoreductase [Oscillatoria amoena NRMC-F 0135]|nr:NAD(P)/FAD-dependent oxidoreductase [Oscillatoria amoena NRMC-F 0135]
MKEIKNVAIIGAGLVGSLLSIYLARRGYSVSVYERRLDMRKHLIEGGRSINLALSNRGIRALEEVGLAEVLKQNAIPMHGRMVHDEQGAINFQPYGAKGQFINSVSRGGLNMVLMTEAEKAGVDFTFEHRCLSVDFKKTELILQHHEAIKHKSYDLIIAADGAFSAVRWAMQLTDRFEFQQTFIEHGYKELRIPAGDNGQFLMEPNALHIWPRESFMLIALPNPNMTFTCTLFLPFEGPNSFANLTSEAAIQQFFEKYFTDAVPMMPTLQEDFRDNATASLVTIYCFPWYRNKTLLIGDAAHGIVPFFGQGMNAGFEDCRVLNELLNAHNDNWKAVFPEFQQLRKPDGDAIARLALDNFVEMRDLVADADFLLRKKIEARLNELYPDQWIPLYTMVTFRDDLRYSHAYATGQKQKAIMDDVMKTPDIASKWEHLNFKSIVNRLAE